MCIRDRLVCVCTCGGTARLIARVKVEYNYSNSGGSNSSAFYFQTTATQRNCTVSGKLNALRDATDARYDAVTAPVH